MQTVKQDYFNRKRRPSFLARMLILAVIMVGTTWGVSPALATGAGANWVGSWATALTAADPGNWGNSLSGFENQSIRMIVQPSIGGYRMRVRLSNVFGEQPLVIGRATIGRPAESSSPDLIPHSVRKLTFNGSPSVTIPTGEEILSDPLNMFVLPLSQLAVTLYLPHATGPTSWHLISKQTTFIYDGDHAAETDGDGYTSTFTHFYFLAGIEVDNPVANGSVAVYGASISDGFGGTDNANTRWPDYLARRLLFTPPFFHDPGVINLSISGNPVNQGAGIPHFGINGLDRLAVDVYNRPDIKTVIIDLGLNDIFQVGDPPELIIDGLRKIVADLQQHGIRAVLCTLSPAAGAPNWSPESEVTRQAVNEFIRTSHEADGVFDLDLVLRDPANPNHLNPDYFSFDEVHPNDLGNEAIANAFPLELLY
ncbi:MAG TPA: GDSL-type esterase/lipase family protein [Gammaproteobacteria bacterium]